MRFLWVLALLVPNAVLAQNPLKPLDDVVPFRQIVDGAVVERPAQDDAGPCWRVLAVSDS